MENFEIDKTLVAGARDKAASEMTVALNASSVVVVPLPPKEENQVTHFLLTDERTHALHPNRAGLSEWRASAETHLYDTVVYVDDILGVGSEKGRLSFYEVTQQRDQSLYEKASCSSDVMKVWNEISHYIKCKLRQGSGVALPGIGSFSILVTKPLAADRKGFMLQRKPIFTLSPMVVKRYRLVDSSAPIYGFRVPTSLIDLAEVAVKTKLSKMVVDGIVTEVIQTFARALVSGKAIEFPFPAIGKLRVKNRISTMSFYAELYRSMHYFLERFGDQATPLNRLASKPWLDKYDLDDPPDVILGSCTPLNRHIPTESFRSVFHLREVRSVHELITVTENDLGCEVDCLQVECLTGSPPQSAADSESSSVSDMVDPCDKSASEFVWCPDLPKDVVPEDEGMARPIEGEEAGETKGYIATWRQRSKHSQSQKSHYEEIAGEGRLSRPVTPAPSIISDSEEAVVSLQPPDTTLTVMEDWDVEPGLPQCRHTYRPEPLCKSHLVGNYLMDMILPQKIHWTNALTSHHYAACTKALGVSTVKKHLTGTKVTGNLQAKSLFHAF